MMYAGDCEGGRDGRRGKSTPGLSDRVLTNSAIPITLFPDGVVLLVIWSKTMTVATEVTLSATSTAILRLTSEQMMALASNPDAWVVISLSVAMR